MTIKLSAGLRNAMLGSQGAAAALAAFVIRIYSGTEPSTADEALSSDSTLLATISLNGAGTGCSFAAPSNGALLKNSNEVWSGTVAQTGVPTYYRLVPIADIGDASATAARIQGSVGIQGDLRLGVTSLTQGDPQTVDYYQLSLPSTGA